MASRWRWPDERQSSTRHANKGPDLKAETDSDLFAVPRFCRRLAIVSNDATALGVASSLVHQPGEYLAVFREPVERNAILFQRDLAKCANSLRFVRPEVLLLYDVRNEVGEFLETRSQAMVIRASTHEEMLQRLESAGFSMPDELVTCRPCDIGIGTLAARRSRRLLVIDETASPIANSGGRESSRRHLVAVDGEDLAIHVLAANYAFATHADMQVLQPCKDDLRTSVYAAIADQYRGRDVSAESRAGLALNEFELQVRTRVDSADRAFVTFITDNLPYGYAVRDVPSTHIFAWSAPHCITSGIFSECEKPGTIVAATVDAGSFEQSEIAAVHDALHRLGCVTFVIPPESAQAALVSQFLMSIPLDFVFICSHGREAPGFRFTVRIPDLSGHSQDFVYDAAISLLSDVQERDGQEMVRVAEHMVYRSYGGEAWKRVPRELRKHVGSYFLKHHDKLPVVARESVPFVPHSAAIQLSDGYLMLNSLQAFDPASSPIVFNNSCLSFYDAASSAVEQGARAYVGTLWPVGTQVACDLATELFEKHRGQPLAQSLFELQRTLVPDSCDRIYVHVGCHFTRFCVPFQGDAAAAQLERVSAAITRWKRALHEQTPFGGSMAEDIIASLRVAERRLSQIKGT